jgi:hypothetical protein
MFRQFRKTHPPTIPSKHGRRCFVKKTARKSDAVGRIVKSGKIGKSATHELYRCKSRMDRLEFFSNLSFFHGFGIPCRAGRTKLGDRASACCSPRAFCCSGAPRKFRRSAAGTLMAPLSAFPMRPNRPRVRLKLGLSRKAGRLKSYTR